MVTRFWSKSPGCGNRNILWTLDGFIPLKLAFLPCGKGVEASIQYEYWPRLTRKRVTRCILIQKKKATKHWRSHVIFVDLRGHSSWRSQMVLLSQHFTIITMEGQEFHLTIPVHVHEMVYCMQCPHRILLVILRAFLTLASDFRSWMIWFSQSESMGDAQSFLWHYFLQAASNKGTLGFRYWMPTRHGWPVYNKHPKFSKLQADSQEALELWG